MRAWRLFYLDRVQEHRLLLGMCVGERPNRVLLPDGCCACLPAWGLGAHGAEFDESLHVQLINVCNGIHQASCKSNLDVLTNNEWK